MLADKHITDYLHEHAQNIPDKPAIITKDKTLSWSELWDLVQAGAEYLIGLLESSDPQIIALLMPNTWQHVVANLSVVNAGHMAMPIDVIYKPLEINAILGQVPPALIISDSQNISRINSKIKTINAEDFIGRTKKTDRKFIRLPSNNQIASLLFTSGTTGQPKVVPLTHRNHIWNVEACSSVWDWTANDSLLVSLRLSHMHGIVMCLSGALYHGNTMYLQDRFDPLETLKLLSSGKISIFTHGPLVYAKLLQVLGDQQFDLSVVRLLISGSGPLPPTVWQKFKGVYGAEIVEVYGTSETGRIASNLLGERTPGSPGRPLPGVELKFSAENEVMVKSPGVFPGYFNNPLATNKNLSPDGFWRTGDIGELKSGRLRLRGRSQETIRKQGYTISPRDIEWALHKDLNIKEVLVVGVQQGSADDKIVYFISGNETQADIRTFCQENLPSVWRPDKIIIMAELPKTRNGKLALPELRAMVE